MNIIVEVNFKNFLLSENFGGKNLNTILQNKLSFQKSPLKPQEQEIML